MKSTWKPVATERYETGGRNTIHSHYNYRVDTNLGKVVCGIRWIPCKFPACVAQLHKYWLKTFDLQYKPIYTCVENYY